MPFTNYGRHLIKHPDFNSPISGNNVFLEVVEGIEKISNNITGRWSGVQASVANAGTIVFTHNFGLAQASLSLVIQEGNTILDEQAAFGTGRYTVVYNTDDQLTITNASGGAISNVSVYVFPRRFTGIQSLELSPVDNAQTGTAVTLTSPTTGITRLTSGSLVSVTGITAPTRGAFFALFNDTGVSVTILNDTGATAANRVLTGTGSNLVLSSGAALLLFYDTTEQRWLVVGGSGGGSTTDLGLLTLGSGGTISGVQSGVNQVRVQGNAGPQTISTAPMTTTDPINGAELYIYGNDSTNTITLPVADAANGFVGNGDCTLGKYDCLHVKYVAAFDRWIEVSRTTYGGF